MPLNIKFCPFFFDKKKYTGCLFYNIMKYVWKNEYYEKNVAVC